MATLLQPTHLDTSEDLASDDDQIDNISKKSPSTETKPQLESKPHSSKSKIKNSAHKITLKRLHDRIHQMTPDELNQELSSRNLSISGVVEIRRFRLKNYLKLESIFHCANPFDKVPQPFEYIAVVDFEATCEKNACKNYQNEIIEFPIVLIDVQKRTIIDKFHSYCRPTKNRNLSDFCIELTGIRQHDVDNAPPFSDVLHQVEDWLYERNLLSSTNEYRLAFATDGPWDFVNFLSMQCRLSSISYPLWAERWIDIRKRFSECYCVKRAGITKMLSKLGLEFDGHPHSGIDDSINIARIVIELLKDGCLLSFNNSIQASSQLSTAKNDQLTEVNQDDEFNDIVEFRD